MQPLFVATTFKLNGFVYFTPEGLYLTRTVIAKTSFQREGYGVSQELQAVPNIKTLCEGLYSELVQDSRFYVNTNKNHVFHKETTYSNRKFDIIDLNK